MKRILLLLISIVLVCSLISCNANNSRKLSIDTNDVDTTSDVITTNAEITLDSIIKLFEEDYNVQEYTAERISPILTNIEKNGVTLNGNITDVIHFTKKGSTPESPDWSWAYVYRFADERDAVAFEEDRRAFVEAVEENGMCVRFDLIVVFGSAQPISSIADI